MDIQTTIDELFEFRTMIGSCEAMRDQDYDCDRCPVKDSCDKFNSDYLLTVLDSALEYLREK